MLDTHLSPQTFSNEQCIVGAQGARQAAQNNLINFGLQIGKMAAGGFGA